MLSLLRQRFSQKETFLIPIANKFSTKHKTDRHTYKKDISPLVSLTEHGRGNLPT